MDETVEISKAKLAELEGIAQIKQALWSDPKFGPQVKEMVKEKFPQANIPEVDAARSARAAEKEILSRVEAKEKAFDDKIAAWEKTQNERDTAAAKAKEEAEFTTEVEQVKKKYQLTPEGMQKVFDRMKAKNSPDVEAAAAWVTDHEQKAPVVDNTFAQQTMDMYGANSGSDEWAELNKNPRAYGDKVIAEMANDFRNGNFSKYKEFGGSV
jgi:hypothetical protein